MSITLWLRHGVISSIIVLLIIIAVFHPPLMVARADTSLDIVPEGQGVRIRWQPDGESDIPSCSSKSLMALRPPLPSSPKPTPLTVVVCPSSTTHLAHAMVRVSAQWYVSVVNNTWW